MSTLSTEHRRALEKAVIDARNIGETAAKAALGALAVGRAKADSHMTAEQRQFRNHLRARSRQLGDRRHANDTHEIGHLVHECAYEHWHRMLFARFLAENNLLIEPDAGMAISLDECKELAKEEKTDLWTLAGRYAQRMLPQIFRADDPLLQVRLAREHELKLEKILDRLPAAVFTATDSLGWCYQFWQSERKDEVNKSGNKIGADELPAVTQLFTEDYMVDFLLDNTLGAWWTGRLLAQDGELLAAAASEDECRRRVALPGCDWSYLRFVKDKKAGWTPAAGTFDGWPESAKELEYMDPCCGSGHFLVAMFDRLVALRTAAEDLSQREATDAVIHDNIHGLEIDPRCTQIAAFNLALAAWKYAGHAELPAVNIACSGLEVRGTKADWVALVPENGYEMEQLYALFKDAPTLGSLINPQKQAEFELAGRDFKELQARIIQGLEGSRKDRDFDGEELGVTAQGLTGAFRLLTKRYHLVATNVPYLGRGKQDEILKDYCNNAHPHAKADLATCVVERCRDLCTRGGTTALVSTQYWLFLTTYKRLRVNLLETCTWDLVSRLGPGAFETISGEVVNVALLVLTAATPTPSREFRGMDVSSKPSPPEKAHGLHEDQFLAINQKHQLANPNSKLVLDSLSSAPPLEDVAIVSEGLHTGDYPRFGRKFWELENVDSGWAFQQGGATTGAFCSGMEHVLFWENGEGELIDFVRERLGTEIVTQWIKGYQVWGKCGVAVGMMSDMKAAIYLGALFTHGICAIVPKETKYSDAIRAFCESDKFCKEVRKLDQKVCAARDSVAKVPFDTLVWQGEAKKKYPRGLPKPHSDDPTQWLFSGDPKGAIAELQVAVARLLGYQWPRQTGSTFPDCPSLKSDELEKLADEDGIVCIPSVRGEPSASDRLLAVLTKCGIKPDRDLDEWLRNSFFDEHCQLYHQRPFIWHVWDGRKHNGFHALVNYHKLADGAKGRRLLEKLTHAYLGDWITRQKAGVKDGEEGAEERLAAALALQERLEAIIAGEPPYDIFVRWKPLAKQALGWEPDINDGVRMNIRPCMADDIPGGKKGAGVLRVAPKVKWTKDRGKEPERPKDEYPWFWEDGEFTGNRVNDIHLDHDTKREARVKASS